jgi:hypothetical protein
MAAVDDEGVIWQQEADRRWREAVEQAGPDGNPADHYLPPPLPDFRAKASPVVKRPVHGRFFIVGTTAHDVYSATEECRIDEAPGGIWVHFEHELPEFVERCRLCH